MSLREKLNKAQEDAAATRRAADLADIDKKMAAVAKGLAAAVEKIIATTQAGEDPPDSIKHIAKCRHTAPTDITQADFEAMPGYRKLIETCSSPDYDIGLYIDVENQSTPDKGSNTSTVHWQAQVEISIYPDRSFADRATLEIRTGQYKSDRIKILPPAAPAPAPVPEPVQSDAAKIPVMAPLKLKS
jgi:hypothetical protein